MTIAEKRDIVIDYCREGVCSCRECVLNNESHNWKCSYGSGHCLDIWHTDEEDLDKAIKLILESDELDKAHDTDKLVDNVNHPTHYQGKNECIDVMVAMFGIEAVKHFCMCNAYKYRFRSNMKNGEEDIKKAEWYEDKLIELGGTK